MLQAAVPKRLHASIRARFGTAFWSDTSHRQYSKTSRAEGATDAALKNKLTKEEWLAEKERRKQIAEDYNERRAAYQREVRELRKKYVIEVAQQREADKAEKERTQRELARRKLERQRLKNIRAVQGALRDKEKKRLQAIEFQKHLEKEKVKREAREERFRQARQMCIDELEKQAHLWLSTPEEVEAAFTPEAEQLLWARPHGVLGAPNPSTDAHFWQQVTHTNKMPKIYKSQRQFYLEQLEDEVYEESNVDEKFWTQERFEETKALEERARFRADLEVTGRKELLKKQAQMIREDFATASDEVPKKQPPPSLRMLSNRKALEEEGVKVLMDNPTKFFLFDDRAMDASLVESRSQRSTGTYRGPTMGAPIGYKKVGQNNYTIFLGKRDRERTEREKRQEEREQRLLAAARSKVDEQTSIEMAAENKTFDSSGFSVDYSRVEYEDVDDWEKGLDPQSDEGKAMLSVPPAHRISEEDMEWTREQLDLHEKHYADQLKEDIETYQSRTRSLRERQRERQESQGIIVQETLEDELENIVLSMPYDEVMALSDLDDAFEDNELSDEQIAEEAAKFPSLSQDQLKTILKRDRTFVPDEPPEF